MAGHHSPGPARLFVEKIGFDPYKQSSTRLTGGYLAHGEDREQAARATSGYYYSEAGSSRHWWTFWRVGPIPVCIGQLVARSRAPFAIPLSPYTCLLASRAATCSTAISRLATISAMQ